MKRSLRGRRALSPLLFATALPATGLALLGTGVSARAQSATEAVGTTLPSSNATPQAQPARSERARSGCRNPPPRPLIPTFPSSATSWLSAQKHFPKPTLLRPAGITSATPVMPMCFPTCERACLQQGISAGIASMKRMPCAWKRRKKKKANARLRLQLMKTKPLPAFNLTGTGPIKPEDVLPAIHLKPGTAYNGKQFLSGRPRYYFAIPEKRLHCHCRGRAH